MRPTPLFMIMLAAPMAVVVVLSTVWLRYAPELDARLRSLTPGMTIGEIERRLGYPLTASRSCTGNSYFIPVAESVRFGQETWIELVTSPVIYDPGAQEFRNVSHRDEICRRVQVMRWSKIAWFNQHEWTWPLLGIDDT